MNCKICGHETQKSLEAKVLNQYQVSYYNCPNCKFIQTEQPFWLAEAYNSPISNIDIGLLSRNIYIQPILMAVINSFFNQNKQFVDYGGGYGVLVRMMRDAGYDFYRQDIYCDNLFADGFDVTDIGKSGKYELLTAFEVFEHLEHPLEEIEKMLSYSDNIFFSTELVPHQHPTPEDWWYFVPETGQHVALYSLESLQVIAQKHNLNLYSNKKNLHLLTRKRINTAKFKAVTSPRAAKLISLLSNKPKSLLPSDFEVLRKKYQSLSKRGN